MRLTFEIPDHIAESLGERAKLERDALEALAAEFYRTEKISRKQLSELLELDYWDTDAFLAQHDANRPYTINELNLDRLALNEKPGDDTGCRWHGPGQVRGRGGRGGGPAPN